MLKNVFSSTASNLFKFAVGVIITFVMTPVYVRELGNYDYGISEMILSLVGYFGLIDMGLRPTISRFTAFFRGGKEPEKSEALFTTSFVLMSLVGVVIGAILIGWSFVAPEKLAPEGGSPARYALVLQLFALQVLLACPRYSMESTFEGQLQYSLKNNVIIFHTIASAVALYYMLPHYDPLLLLCWANIAQAVSKLIIFLWVLATPAYGSNRLSPARFSWNLAKEMYRFGFKAFVQGIASRIETKADVLVIGSVIGPQAVVFYSIPQALSSRIRELVQVLSHVMMPAFAELHSAGKKDRIVDVFMISSRLIVGVLGLLGGGIVLLGGEFIRLWMGPEYAERGQVVLWCLVAYVSLSYLIPLESRYLTAINRHGILAKITIVRAILNITSSLVLVNFMGVVGVALGSVIATALTAPVIWASVFKHLGVSRIRYLREVLQPTLLAVGAMTLAVYLAQHAQLHEKWMGLIEKAVLGGLVFVIAFYVFALTGSDRAKLMGVFRAFRGSKTPAR